MNLPLRRVRDGLIAIVLSFTVVGAFLCGLALLLRLVGWLAGVKEISMAAFLVLLAAWTLASAYYAGRQIEVNADEGED